VHSQRVGPKWALFNAADPSKARAISAGTEPGPRVHPEVIEVMREKGFDLTSVVPRKLTDAVATEASVLVTMGCGETCPLVRGSEHHDWPIDDPKGQRVDCVRAIRDELEQRVRRLLDVRGWLR
jgi:arsenate reductase